MLPGILLEEATAKSTQIKSFKRFQNRGGGKCRSVLPSLHPMTHGHKVSISIGVCRYL